MRGAAADERADPLRRLGQAGNAAELLAQPDVDGALVGGASLDAADFAAIVGSGRVTLVPSLALVILDGWGLAAPGPGNAISLANTPVFDAPLGRATRTPSSPPRAATSACPTARWATPRSATSTSAPGRSSSRTWPGSTTPIADGSFFENEALLGACERARKSPRGRLHLLGLVSDGGVHSGWEHIEATIELASQEGVPDVVFHAFTDGRDTLPHGGRSYLAELERWLRQAGRDRHRQRPLLRDGPRHPLGADQARLRRDRPRPRACDAASAAEAIEAAYERERDRRVRQADRDRRLRRRRRGRRRDLRQLPPRPGPAS